MPISKMPSHNQPEAEPKPTISDWRMEWNTHQRWLRTVIWARVYNSHAVDDVMQEVALAAAKGLKHVEADKAGPWLYRVAIRQVLLRRRRLGRQQRLENPQGWNAAEEDGTNSFQDTKQSDPLDWLLSKELQALVTTAMRTVPRKDAEILLLKYTEDWTYKQMASHLGVSQTAVEARLHRARKKLRSALNQLDPTLATKS